MVLVDTSIWLRFLRNHSPFAGDLTLLLRSGMVAGHELVFGELLIGDPGGRRDLTGYGRLPLVANVSHGVELVRVYKLYGQEIGWVA